MKQQKPLTDLNHTFGLSLKCPSCDASLSGDETRLSCNNGHSFPMIGGIPDCTPPDIPVPEIYNDPDYKRFQEVASTIQGEMYSRGGPFVWLQDYGHRYLEKHVNIEKGWRLDLGCGIGRHMKFLEDDVQYVGLDGNIESLQVAKSERPGTPFLKARMERLPFWDDMFSTVYAIYSLEHVFYIKEALAEIKRVTKDQGTLLIGLPTEGGFMYDSLRRLSSSQELSRRFDMNYDKAIRIEHCNTATAVLRLLDEMFEFQSLRFFPFLMGKINGNLIACAVYKVRKND